MEAIEAGNTELVNFLLIHGANPDKGSCKTYGYSQKHTLLSYAHWLKHSEIATLLETAKKRQSNTPTHVVSL